MVMAEEEVPLGQILRSSWHGIPAGPWQRHVKAEWLGPYTPTCVEPWVLKLMRKDPQLKFGLAIIKNNFLALTYRLRGGSPDARRFVQKTLGDGKLLQPLIRSILNALDFGFQAHEILWDVQDVELPKGNKAKGAKRRKLMPNAYVFRRFLDIDPERVTMEQNDRGELVGVRLDGRELVGGRKLLLAVHDVTSPGDEDNAAEWQNYYSDGLLRAAYNPWYWCNFLNLYKMRYSETRITPTLKTRAPFRKVTGEDAARTNQENKNTMDAIAEQALAIRNGSVASLPNELIPGTTEFAWDIELLRDEGRIEQFMIAINHQQAMKLRALLIPERSATQDTTVGSFASIREMVNILLSILEGIKQGTIIPTLNLASYFLTRANFGKSEEAPYWEASELARQNREALFKLVEKAAAVPRTLEDGRKYTGLHLVDLERAFEAFDIPFNDPEDVAEDVVQPVAPEPEREPPIEPQGEGEPAGEGEPTDETAPSRTPEEEGARGGDPEALLDPALSVLAEDLMARKRARGSVEDLAAERVLLEARAAAARQAEEQERLRLERQELATLVGTTVAGTIADKFGPRLEPPPPPPPAPAPVVNVTNVVNPTPVTVENTVEVETPEVNVTNKVEPTPVNIENRVEVKGSAKRIIVERDANGDMREAIVRPEN